MKLQWTYCSQYNRVIILQSYYHIIIIINWPFAKPLPQMVIVQTHILASVTK